MAKKPASQKTFAKISYKQEIPLKLIAKDYTYESRKQTGIAAAWMVGILYLVFLMMSYNLSVLGSEISLSILLGNINIDSDDSGIELLRFLPINVLFLTLIGLLSRLVAFYLATSRQRKTTSLEILALDNAIEPLSPKRRADIVTDYFSKNNE